MEKTPSSTSDLLRAQRLGDANAAERLLKQYEPWMRILAQTHLDAGLRRKVAASDIVQQTMLEAVRGLVDFRGATEGEWQAWLRRILARRIAHAVRQYRGTLKRGGADEVSIDQSLAQSSQRFGAMLAGRDMSPSERAMSHERLVLLAEVLEHLPDDYREVIVLRSLQDLPHEEVAKRMNRSVGAVRMLWLRALAKLREELPAEM